MPSDSSSSTSGDDISDRNPDPEQVNDQLASVSLTEVNGQLSVAIQESQNGVEYESARDSDGGEEIENIIDEELVHVTEEGLVHVAEEELVHVAEEEVSNNCDTVGVVAEEEEISEGLRRGGVIWHRTISELEVDGMASPSSSGYAGERGTSSSSGGGSVIDEIVEDEMQEMKSDAADDRVLNSEASWVPGKRHVDEDDASMSWRKRKKHFFILSHSGKPIYSRYGDEHKLAGFSATLQAIISFVEDGGDRLKLVRAGKHQMVFLVKGPIYLVCISCTDEPYESLRRQLELIYSQMILILTQSINRCFEKNPKFDMTPLLGGTDVVFSSLIHSFSRNPATFFHAYTCLPLGYATRQAAGAILQDVAGSGVLFAILMCGHKVISLVGAQKASLHPDDMLLLANFVMSSESFRTSESFSPICLPRYNPMAFLHAYVHYFDADTYLVLLTTSSDAFYHLKDCRIRIEAVLLKSQVLGEVQRSMLHGGMHVENLPVDPIPRSGSLSQHFAQQRLPTESYERPRVSHVAIGGPTGLWHFIYRSIFLDQYVSSEFSAPISSPKQQKRLYRAYEKLYASMHDRGIGPYKTQFRRDENYVLFCWITQDFELYAAFDPLADKASAIKTCNRVCQWIKDVENEIFLLGASPFSW